MKLNSPSECKFTWNSGADPGFDVREGLGKIYGNFLDPLAGIE